MPKIEELTFLIKKNRSDSFWNHIVTFWNRDNFVGNFDGSKILLWSSNGWIGLGYPVFTIRKNTLTGKIELLNRYNIAFKIFYVLFILVFSSVFFVWLSELDENPIQDSYPAGIVTLLLPLVAFITIRVVYRLETSKQQRLIQEAIKRHFNIS